MSEPKLDKPGAGLPWPQKWILPFLVPRMAKRTSWEECGTLFKSQSEKLLKLIEGLDDKAMQTQVLVPRLQGLEDSSRYWSVAMTLEHLVIVGEGMSQIIVELSRGNSPSYVVDTAKVKPQNQYDAATAKREFAAMVERVSARIANEVKDRNSRATHNHPWFGPFTAHQWYWLLGSHQGIHRQQIKHIIMRKG